MAINIRRYIDIVSGVGGGAGVRQRDLIGRLFTANPILPAGTLLEATDIESVGAYFGTASEEYKRAQFYFSWISKNTTRAKKIGFARWVAIDSAPQVFGKAGAQNLGTWQAITNGSLTLTMGGETRVVTGMDFSGAPSLSGVAAIVETAINAASAVPLWASATVDWDAVAQRFILTGGVTGSADIEVAAGGGTDVAGLLGWLDGAVLSPGAVAESVTDALTASAGASNNFGSYLFIPTLPLNQVVESANWCASQNVLYQFMVAVSASDRATWSDALDGLAGTAMTLRGPNGQYHEMVPMIILAATDYTARNSVQNYMFQQFPTLSPTVSTTADANIYDPLRINYYGRTQTAGQYLDFYQRGVLGGGATAPVDMNTYANEQWLKDACGAALMSLLLSLARVSANAQGRAQILTTVQSVVDQALFNGVISVGKALNVQQKLYIKERTGDDLAWLQVQNAGYWLDAVMQSYVTTDGRTEYKAVYTLIYSKDDAVRAIDGTHTLI